MKQPQYQTVTLEKIVGGGQAIGTLEDGRKAFVWGGLPGERVTIRVTKKKSHFVEGTVTEVEKPGSERIAPADPGSYLSTSPWQIMTSEAEQRYKAALIEEAFELHDIVLPDPIEVYTDGRDFHYRNKVEFSWYGDKVESLKDGKLESNDSKYDSLDLAFFQRGGKGKIIVDQCSLLPENIMTLARSIRDLLAAKQVSARELKTLLIRCDQNGSCVWQLYVKTEDFTHVTAEDAANLPAKGGEIIYSDPKSPASRITKRLAAFGDIVLTDTILGVPFRYATEGFFQVNIPVYEQALKDMLRWTHGEGRASASSEVTKGEVQPDPFSQSGPARNGDFDETASLAEKPAAGTGAPRSLQGEEQDPEFTSGSPRRGKPLLDFYSGVGSIGLTIGGDNCTLIEIDEHAVREMRRNIKEQGSDARAVLAPSEKALEYITGNELIILDPPRAGLHAAVTERLLETLPLRIVYLSCNPVTQARDVALLAKKYGIRAHRGYNFFPRTPHIEHLVVLDRLQDHQ